MIQAIVFSHLGYCCSLLLASSHSGSILFNSFSKYGKKFLLNANGVYHFFPLFAINAVCLSYFLHQSFITSTLDFPIEPCFPIPSAIAYALSFLTKNASFKIYQLFVYYFRQSPLILPHHAVYVGNLSFISQSHLTFPILIAHSHHIEIGFYSPVLSIRYEFLEGRDVEVFFCVFSRPGTIPSAY